MVVKYPAKWISRHDGSTFCRALFQIARQRGLAQKAREQAFARQLEFCSAILRSGVRLRTRVSACLHPEFRLPARVHESLRLAMSNSASLRSRRTDRGRVRQLHGKDQRHFSDLRSVDALQFSDGAADVHERDLRPGREPVLCRAVTACDASVFCRLAVAGERGTDGERRFPVWPGKRCWRAH